MFIFTPVDPNIDFHHLSPDWVDGVLSDQLTVLLLRPSQGDTLWTVSLVDLGDSPWTALAALISRGPLTQVRLPIRLTAFYRLLLLYPFGSPLSTIIL